MFGKFFYTLIINISLMLSFIYILNRVKPFSLNKNSALITKVYYSIGFVTLSILTMHFNFNSNGNSIDLRFIPVMVAGFFGGPVTGTVTGLLVGIYRLDQTNSYATIITAVEAIALGFGLGFFTECRYRKNRFLIIPAFTGTLIIIFFGFVFSLINNGQINQFHLLVSIMHPIGFIFMVFLLKDLINMNEHRKQLEQEATVDAMTGLFNFRYFDNSLKEILHSAISRSEKITVAIIDIDNFKMVNDTYGHQAGDEVLRQLGGVLSQSLRPFDIAARYGGEEFAAILPNTECTDAYKIGERIRKNVENNTFQLDDVKIQITVSIGVTTFPDFALNEDELIRQSDKALYKAKETGRNKVISYSDIIRMEGRNE